MDHPGRALAARLARLGFWSLQLERLTAREAQRAVAAVEELGYGAIWIPEAVTSKEVFAHAALLLSATQRVPIATGIANLWARDAYAMANGARALADAFPGRFVLGLGVSHEPAVRRRGSQYERPLERMREYLDAMDAARWTGPESTEPPPRVLAALGPKMLRLAAARTAGAHPYFVPVEHTKAARRTLGAGPLLAVEQALVPERNPERAREIARAHMRGYLRLDNYANNLRRLGWQDADLANGGSDALVDAIVAWGDQEALAARVRAHWEAGADHVCVQVLGPDLASVPLEELRELAALR
jgi:probable F420-dependent oxidoreductase